MSGHNLIRAGNRGQAATASLASTATRHCGICNLQNLKDAGEFESHSLRQPSLMIKCEGCPAVAPKGRRRTSSLFQHLPSFG